ncbi:DUF2911 domain-containing protein [Confluentibacter citreus]|uniref:DUF2911 domain-containing protein n=1 Tax=Confluentibacter citreus TaxID=2007307 RepID=UPI000C2828EB|nr:DUF2911 domain-containing protein [Confluentibacter citreus]
MKKLLVLLLTITTVLAVEAQIVTPQPSPSSKVEQKVGLTDVTLEYSRPNMRGRKIFGDLVPYGQVWRLGANQNTKITFSTDVKVGEKTLKAGTYAVYAIPNATAWDVIFYTDATNGGLPAKWDDAKVAAKVNAEIYPLPMNIETFTISFDDLTSNSGVLGIMWEQIYVGVKIDVPTDDMVLTSINNVMNATPTANDYFNAAVYYLQENKDIKQAKTWIDKAITMAGDKAPFWQLRQQSLIYAKAGDKAGAIAVAKKSLAASEEEGNADYVKLNKDSLKEWGAM